MIHISDLIYTTVCVSITQYKKSVDTTGFIIKTNINNEDKYLLFTCAHYYDDYYKLKMTFRFPQKIGVEGQFDVVHIYENPIIDKTHDIAITDVTKNLSISKNESELSFHFIELSDIVANQERNFLSDIEDVYLVGYRFRVDPRPIILKGNTATLIKDVYNNGALVYLNTEEAEIGSPIYIRINDRFKLLGFLKEPKTESHTIDLDGLRKTYEINTGLIQSVYAYHLIDFIKEQYPLVTKK